MLDEIHSTLQFPMVIMLLSLGLIMVWQARRVVTGDVTRPSAAVMVCFAGFFVAFAIRQGFWHFRWLLRSNDLHAASDAMLTSWLAWLPVAANIVSLIFGAAAISIVMRGYIGKYASSWVIAVLFCVIGIGAILAGVGS